MKKTIITGKKLISVFSVLAILAVSLFSVFMGVSFKTDATTPNVEVWDGIDETPSAVQFDGGEGSATNPYLISNGDQLYRMVLEGGKSANGAATYYKLTNDIYLNDVSEYDRWKTSASIRAGLNNWCQDNALAGKHFFGTFDGDGHNIYGLYCNANGFTAFISDLTEGATVKNTHFKNAYIYNSGEGTWSGGAGVIMSRGYHNSEVDDNIYIKNCSVRDSYVYGDYAAALIGLNDGDYPVVKNCLVEGVTVESYIGVTSAILNEVWGFQDCSTISDCIIVGLQAYGTQDEDLWNGYKVPLPSYKYLFKNFYSDVSHEFSYDFPTKGHLEYTDTEITVVDNSDLKGLDVVNKLNLDFEYDWLPVEGDYPVPRNEYIIPSSEGYVAENEVDVWNGKTARYFAAGTGTVEDPYIIETCAQFYFMIDTLNANKYYKIADGVKTLDFNNLPYTPGEANKFQGYFDGNGATITGVKYEGGQSSLRAGLFPQVGSCTIKNLVVTGCYFKTNGVDGAAALVGDLADESTVNIRNVAVIDNEVIAVSYAAGLVACAHTNGCVFVDDCIVANNSITSAAATPYTGAFVAGQNGGSTATVKNSVAVGVYPAADNEFSYKASYVNVYTNIECPSEAAKAYAGGITVVKDEAAFKGEAARTTLQGFDWSESWSVTDSYPMPKKHISSLGTVGGVWSGKIADGYAGGSGTANNPYQIDTPERLAQMLAYSKAGAYYELTADINLNEVNWSDWTTQPNLNQWLTSKDVNTFKGKFNGAGYTIYGLYNKDVPAGVSAGLFPVLGSAAEIRNVRIDCAYLSGVAGANIGAVAGMIEENAITVSAVRAANIGSEVKLEGAATIGGVVGYVGFTRFRLDNSTFEGTISASGANGGLVGSVSGILEAKQSISVGVYPFGSAQDIIATDIYTNASGSVAGVTTLAIENMKGENAKTYMTGLNYDDPAIADDNGAWLIVSDSTPIPTGNFKSFNGVRGEVWSGEIASEIANGSGTANDPYMIYTGEELALLINTTTYSDKYIKLGRDIYLNNISDKLWQAKVGANSWYDSQTIKHGFTGVFDGDGYVVFGLHYYNESAPIGMYVGLFPIISNSVVIKNLGVSNLYIKTQNTTGDIYAGGIFGMNGGFYGYNFYAAGTNFNQTENDEFNIPGTGVKKLPLITNCFIDHTSYISSGSVGGMGNAGGNIMVYRDCYSTATLIGTTDMYAGTLHGNQWSKGTRIYDCIAFPQIETLPSVGTHQWSTGDGDACYYIEDFYYFGNKGVYGATKVPRPAYRIGEEAKTAMPGLDWENTWRTEPEGTPVLRVFDKPNRSAGIFSDKYFQTPDVTISFNTGSNDVVVPSITGKMYEPLTLPTPVRDGYKFTGWYAFPDLSLLYPYDFFLSYSFNLYAGWELTGMAQNFEEYPDSMWDLDEEEWLVNRPGVRGGYKAKFVRNGGKSMRLVNKTDDAVSFLVNYENVLNVGQEYEISFWVTTDTENNPATTLSLVHNTYPDYMSTDKGVEKMADVTGLTVGEWTKYTYKFTAKTPWVSFRAKGASSIYIDDIVAARVGEILPFNYTGAEFSMASTSTSPDTSDNGSATIIAMIAAIMSCAIIMIISKKAPVEVIEKQ